MRATPRGQRALLVPKGPTVRCEKLKFLCLKRMCEFKGCSRKAFKPKSNYCTVHRCKICETDPRSKHGESLVVPFKRAHLIVRWGMFTFCGIYVPTDDGYFDEMCDVKDCEKPKCSGSKYCAYHHVISCTSCHSKIVGKFQSRCYNCYNNDLYSCCSCETTYNKKFIIQSDSPTCYLCAYEIPDLRMRDLPLRVTNEIVYLDYKSNYNFLFYLYNLYNKFHRQTTWELGHIFKLPRDVFTYILNLTQLPPYLIPLNDYIRQKHITHISFFIFLFFYF